MIHKLQHLYAPNKITLLRTHENASELVKIAPYTRDQKSVDQKTTAYICRDYRCERPVTDPERISKWIKG